MEELARLSKGVKTYGSATQAGKWPRDGIPKRGTQSFPLKSRPKFCALLLKVLGILSIPVCSCTLGVAEGEDERDYLRVPLHPIRELAFATWSTRT